MILRLTCINAAGDQSLLSPDYGRQSSSTGTCFADASRVPSIVLSVTECL